MPNNENAPAASAGPAGDLVILAIDPGYDRLGVAVLALAGGVGKPILLFSDCVVTDKKNPHEKRLTIVGQAVAELIKKWQPAEIAIEELFFSANQKTALLVSQALGVIVYEATRSLTRNGSNAPVFYYTPGQVKVAVTGYGQSDKAHVTSMVPRLVAMTDIESKIGGKGGKNRLDDEYDAIAVGLTHLASRNSKK